MDFTFLYDAFNQKEASKNGNEVVLMMVQSTSSKSVTEKRKCISQWYGYVNLKPTEYSLWYGVCIFMQYTAFRNRPIV